MAIPPTRGRAVMLEILRTVVCRPPTMARVSFWHEVQVRVLGPCERELCVGREVQVRCAWSWTSVKGLKPKWLAEKRIHVLYQMGLSKHADLPDVPLIIDLARSDEERAMLRFVFARQVMAWPFLAPPGVPADRVALLRAAFVATMRDKAFLADADAARLEISPVPGEELQRLVAEIYATPAEIARRVAELIK